jgi:hypothetical protein
MLQSLFFIAIYSIVISFPKHCDIFWCLLGICGRNFGHLATLETTPYSVKKTPARRAILKMGASPLS